MPRSLFPAASPQTRARLEQDSTLKRLNDFDWSAGPLGPIPSWPESLKGAVRVMMTASTPMVMYIGADGILVYNDAYAEFAGSRHPAIFGMPAEQAWPEVAQFNREKIAMGLRGTSEILRDQELVLNRHGQPEQVWMDLHFSPVLDDEGRPLGTLSIVHETTGRVMAEKSLARSDERLTLALSGSGLVGTWDWNVADNRVTADDRFAALFGIDPLRSGIGVPVESYFECVHPDDLPRLQESLEVSLRTGSQLHAECRIVAPDGSVRWLVASAMPRRDAEGRVQRLPGVAVDVTEQRRVAEALAESELRFRTLTDAMPQMVWSAQADGTHDYFNARWVENTGYDYERDSQTEFPSMLHPDDQQRAAARWNHSLKTGENYQIEYRLRTADGSYRWMLALAQPMRDETGAVLRWFGTCTDIHETRLAAEERELVAQELSHRIKNIFAVLTGIISLSARSQPAIKPFADQLRQRIFALSEAHDLVRPHGVGTEPAGTRHSLRALVERLLRPYDQDQVPRLQFSGDDVEIDDGAATPLALLVHELATNAAKYGALATPDGRIALAGRRDGERYHLTWKELGGPGVTIGARPEGFGSRVIALSIEGQLGGNLSRSWEADGLRVEIDLPVAALWRSARLQGQV